MTASTGTDERDQLIERLKLEAQTHAQEARTANATIAEIYRVVTGGTGEPGNWNGAEPVRNCIEDLRASLGAAQVPSLDPAALEALKSYQQADADGGMVTVSRQALEMAIDAFSQPSVGVAQVPAPSETWIVVKEHVWEHGDGERPTLAYLLPSEFGRETYPSFEAAHAFIKEGNWPLGFVAMKLDTPEPTAGAAQVPSLSEAQILAAYTVYCHAMDKWPQDRMRKAILAALSQPSQQGTK